MSFKNVNFCTACGAKNAISYHSHPLLEVPICKKCNSTYHEGEFVVGDDGPNEIYCRWCGEGKGELLLCDSCPKSFCTDCVHRNLGSAESNRIKKLDNRWSCFICSPQPIVDLCIQNGWISFEINNEEKNMGKFKYICRDVSRGRERFEIPVVNEVDNTPPPLDFVYVTKPVPSEGVILSNNPERLPCCTCTDNCRDPKRCECALRMDGFAYDTDKLFLSEKPNGIYECNDRCSCHVNRCGNRLVGRGPNIKLEVFRCHEIGKGWGLRCATDIPSGTFVADYIGEIMLEEDTERRGLSLGDEYLYNLDQWGRSRACLHMTELGLKRGLVSDVRQHDVDVSTMPLAVIKDVIGTELTEMLAARGVIDRAHALGKKRRHEVNIGLHDEKLPVASAKSSEGSGDNEKTVAVKSWYKIQKESRVKAWRRARSVLTDRVLIDTENIHNTFAIDARWYGNVARFLNHSCNPNIEKLTVFTDSHDVRYPRVAFFTSQFVSAGTELTYDYGYYAGLVEGKHRECLCGASYCRKTLY